jgi:hypothetical protein
MSHGKTVGFTMVHCESDGGWDKEGQYEVKPANEV